MNEVPYKQDIQKRGRLFVLYMGLAAFALTFGYFGVLEMVAGHAQAFTTYGLVVLFAISLIVGIVSIFSSFICWHMNMKNGVTRKKATKAGRLSVLLSYVILGLIAGLIAAGTGDSYTGTWVINVAMMTWLYAVGGMVATGLAAFPIGHYIGVIITPESFADRLATYRKEKYAWREDGD